MTLLVSHGLLLEFHITEVMLPAPLVRDREVVASLWSETDLMQMLRKLYLTCNSLTLIYIYKII